MAGRVIASVPQDQPIHYVEIGCGEANFFKLVMHRSGGRCVSATGFDPSYSGPDDLAAGMEIHRSFFGEAQLSLVPDATNVICWRHTIEHVADLHLFLAASFARHCMMHASSSLRHLMQIGLSRKRRFRTFFYEHCSIYTPASLELALAQHGMTAKTAQVYGGQYMWTEAQLSRKPPDRRIEINRDPASHYSLEREHLLDQWAAYIQNAAEGGPVAIWGTASKGVTFLLLLSALDDARAGVDCAIDMNPAKQGCYLPVTGLPIVNPAAARQRGIRSIMVMNPNYIGEITELVRWMGWDARIKTLND